MSAAAPVSWTELFDAQGTADFTLAVRVIKKAGQPFLIVPDSGALAAQALALYPAQSKFARLARLALGAALRMGLPLGLERAVIRLSRSDPFAQFLIDTLSGQARFGEQTSRSPSPQPAPLGRGSKRASRWLSRAVWNGATPSWKGHKATGEKSESFPALAILAGNPRVAGRRFIVLPFDAGGKPACVVKAGIGESARRLIQRESLFLQSAPARISGLPKFYAAFNSERVAALALGYVAGDSPVSEDRQVMGKLFTSWLDRENRLGLGDVPAWQTLAQVQAANPLFQRLAAKLARINFHPTLFHGDFAPWNIKVSRADGFWQILDWERGERVGFPGWDWFHYVTQTGILVEKLSAEEVAGKIEGLLESAAFREYAATAGMAGSERVLVVAYLFYCVEVLRPTEGLETARKLLALFAER